MTPVGAPTVFVIDTMQMRASIQGRKHGLNDWPDLVPSANQTSPPAEPLHEGGDHRAEHGSGGNRYSICEMQFLLGLEVKGGPQAPVHVKGHGRVLMDNPPGAPIA